MMVPIQNFYSKHRVNIYTMPSRVTWKSGAGSQYEKMRGYWSHTGDFEPFFDRSGVDRR